MKFYILNFSPLTFLRISTLNFIDVIVCVDEISPVRHVVNFNLEKIYRNNYLTETILINNSFLVEIPDLKFKIMQSNESVLLILLNNIYKIDIPYLQTFTDILELYFDKKSDLKFYSMKSTIVPIVNFNYKKQFKPGFMLGYYGIELFSKKRYDKSILLISFLNGMKVKCLQLEQQTKQENEFIMKRSNMEIPKSIQNLEKLAESTSLEVIDNIKDDQIIGKDVELDEEHVKKIELENIQDFIEQQVTGIYKHYDSLLAINNSKMMHKTKIYSEIFSNLDSLENTKHKAEFENSLRDISKLKTSIIEKNDLIKKKIESVHEKLFRVQVKDKTLFEIITTIKSYFEKYKKSMEDM